MSRALAIAQLVRLYGPAQAREIVQQANKMHRRLNPNGCEAPACPVCRPPSIPDSGAQRASEDTNACSTEVPRTAS